MKIAYITMQFPVPSETFASLDVNVLSELGHEVAVYAMRTPHRNYQLMVKQRHHERLTIRHFRWRFSANAMLAALTQPVATFHLTCWLIKNCFSKPDHLVKGLTLMPVVMWHFKSIRHERFDVVHLFWGHYPSMLGYLVWRYLPKIKVTQFLGAHDLIVNFPCSFALGRRLRNIVTHCHANVNQIASCGIDPSKIKVIHRGVAVFNPVICSDKFGGLKAPLFLTAGRLIDDKGVDDVISIFKRVLDNHPNARLIIAGDGPSRCDVETLVKSNGLNSAVTFLGHVSQGELFKLMSHAHFFLIMSRYPADRLPNVIKEAMLRHCVVITTKTPGIEELVSHEKTGFVVDFSDVNSASSIIETCVFNEDLSRKISNKAAETIRSHFDVRVSMQRYLTLWQQ